MSSNIFSNKAAFPYAEALFLLSQSKQTLENTRKDLSLIDNTINQSTALKSFLFNPLIVNDAKKNVLKDLFLEEVGIHVLNFLFILIERRRMNLLNVIMNCYISLVNQLDLVTLVTVYTVVPFNEQQEKSLKDTLKVLTNSNSVQLNLEIQTNLIGGFIIKIGSKVIDMSIYGQLSQISSHLNGAYI